MLYLSGSTNHKIEPAMRDAGIGVIVQPGSGYVDRLSRFPFWAADNGCFNPTTYIGDDAWLSWLDRLPRRGCLFAVVPDVSRRLDGSLGGDPVATWEKFVEYGPLVQDMAFPAALAAQDGIESMSNVADQLDALDCLFLAGSTEWKIGPEAEALARAARLAGKWVHMGRCNSRSRLERARAMGCNSADGTFLAFGPDKNLPRLRRWLLWLEGHPPLPGFNPSEAPSLPVHRDAYLATTERSLS